MYCRVKLALHLLGSKTPKPNVQMRSKPSRKVFSLQKYKKNALTLIPETTNIASNDKDPSENKHAIDIGPIDPNRPDFHFYLYSPNMNPDPEKNTMNVPFWGVRSDSPPVQ